MEGDTYQSGIGHMEAIDIERIPDAIARGNFKPVVIDGEPTIITFDLETTGLIVHRVMPDITQIAASDQSGKTFNVYVNPIQPINPEATTVTGISFVNGEMKVRGQIVQSVHVKDAVSQFLSWLEQFKNVVLCAHNGRRFDFLILVELLEKLHLSEKFSEIVPALLDTMSIFRKQYPKSSLKQEDLVKTHLGITYDAHNAVGDVISLGKLISYMNIDKKELIKNTFSVSAVYNNLQFNNAKAKNIQSLEVLIYSGVCKRPTAENVAGSGLNLGYLRLIHKRRGEDGLREVFTSLNNEGLPRVTNSKKVLEDFIPKLINYLLK
ncbi:uncharacterized protein LOC123528174 [Mercenaria mercenaria]|uniref:uncharacterized protein LOC123528174 n=1 Tax=Mercenaria mercenaria TaxID=6596 RepID=UPI00234F7816|nr:uncharacterized protein LOC123528174 [Mercenaria mercenaria]